ncbi:AP-4 complex subunit [Musa troglodytarum]|uniref:4-coumarate--CoA ligase n=1 Tax=Musa troglodytarum TaxID=320322 RepID=A0A9E7KKT5_9LILI|nr:AP-4 complex subunit [Musa troglodytarum]
MAFSLHSNIAVCGLDRRCSSELYCFRQDKGLFPRTRRSLRGCRFRGHRVSCHLELESLVRRKCCPYLEGYFLSSSNDPSLHEWSAVPDIWKSSAEKYGDRVALVDPYHEPPTELTYKQLEQEILNFSEGLRVVGVAPDEKLALFADNSCRWLIADQGIMATGAINVVRGTRSSNEELFHIYDHSESDALVVDNPQFFNRLAESFITRAHIRFVVLLWGEKSHLKSKFVDEMPIYEYKDIVELGQQSRHAFLNSWPTGQKYVYEAINREDVATLMYTSGTSGIPKGVMLTHQNLLHQIKNLWDIVPAEAGDRFLSMLPTWHAYERAAEYFIFTYGIEQDDLKLYQPRYLISVPLVYETLYSSIQKQISSSSGARKFVALMLIKISLLYMEAKRIYEGGVLTKENIQESLIIVVKDWLWARIVAVLLWPLHMLAMKLVYSKIHSAIGISKAIGVTVQNGYGLTETSPVVAARRPSCNVLGTIGHPLKYTEIKIVDMKTGEVLSDGLKGIVKVKGPQVMKGYYKNPSATSEALDEEGWFNTGDIGWIAPMHSMGRSRNCGGMVVLEGRSKDTIVLSTGENVEPTELEAAAMRSSLIQQIMVIGQDQRRLGAIIVPNKDEVLAVARRQSIVNDDSELTENKMMSLLYDELKTWTVGFSFRIGPILIADEPFTIDNGLLTPTMKIRRNEVADRYSEQIEQLYNSFIFHRNTMGLSSEKTKLRKYNFYYLKRGMSFYCLKRGIK